MPTVRTIARRLTRTPADAQDATQVALLEVLRSAGMYRGEGSLKGWASRITMRSVARGAARQHVHAGRTVSDDTLATRHPSTTLATDVVDALPRPLREYLDELPDPQRIALVLRHSLGCTIPEISTMTETPIPTVKSRLRKAMERIRQAVRRDVRFGSSEHHEVGA